MFSMVPRCQGNRGRRSRFASPARVEVLMEGEFAAVVEGDRSTGGFRQWAEDLSEGVIGGLGLFAQSGAVNVKRVFLSQRVSRLPRCVRNCMRSPSQ